MPHFDELYPGRFLKGTTLAGPMTIRITSMGGEKLEGDDGMKAKGILKYQSKNGPGEIVWCKTNAILTAAILGEDYTQWAGKLITIFHDPSVKFGPEKVGGIRVYGAPTLTANKTVSVKRPRRKTPDVFTLRPTGKPPAKSAAPAPPPAEEPSEIPPGGDLDSEFGTHPGENP